MLVGAIGCSEFSLHEEPVLPPAVPPGRDQGPGGVPPDWNDCEGGYAGHYFNLPDDHPDVETRVSSLDGVDWWDERYASFERYEPSLDLGPSWWPVDEAFANDPRYFAAVWYGWIRVEEGGGYPVIAGSATDLQVVVGETVVVEQIGATELDTRTYDVDLQSGVAPVVVRFAHRIGEEDGMRFRFGTDQVQLCYPAWE